jgi:hypothetical protein
MDQSSVIGIANHTAVAKGVKLERYNLENVSFEFIDRTWTIFFDEKKSPYSFDGCFRVLVNDRTGESEFRACP